MAEKITLSLLRARIRAGEYQDDLHSPEENRLIFLRWLVQQGCFNEWDVEEQGKGAALWPLPSFIQETAVDAS